MEIEPQEKRRSGSFAFLVTGLVVMAGALGALVFITTDQASTADQATRAYLLWLAWMAMALLSLTLVALLWAIVRYMVRRTQGRKQRTATPYVNAWSLAGKRFKLEDQTGRTDQDEGGGESHQ